MKPQASFRRVLLPGLPIILIVLVGMFLWKGKMNDNQNAALYNTNLLACPFNSTVPQVRIYQPNGGETFYSGQTILVKWGKCHIPAGTTGTLVLTKVGGSGPVTYGPFSVTSSQSQLNIPIAPLPGVFNGSNATTGVYTATITYGTTADGSDSNFFIVQSPVGVQMIHGNNLGSYAANGQFQATLSIQYPLKAMGADIYLDKDVLVNAASTALGGQQIKLQEYITTGNGVLGASTVFDAQVISPPTLSVITPNISLLPNGTYKIPAGQEVIFKITTQLKTPASATAPYHRAVLMTWSGFGFALSDVNGNMIELNYEQPWGPTAYLDLW